MRRLLAIALLLSWVAPARAQTPGVHVSWSECLPKGGLRNFDFTCDTNEGSETLVLAVSPAVAASQVVAFEGPGARACSYRRGGSSRAAAAGNRTSS